MKTLFVWRDIVDRDFRDPNARDVKDRLVKQYNWQKHYSGACNYCGTTLLQREAKRDGEIVEGATRYDSEICLFCPLCGWKTTLESTLWDAGSYGLFEHIETAILRAFDLSSAEVAYTELGSHLKTHFDDIYLISPERFEQLIADVFKNYGFHAELTKRSKDGGADILLYTNGENPIIIECKRYKHTRKVGITIVDRLLGAQVCFGTRQAKLITTSSFSLYAKKRVHTAAKRGFQIDLIDASDILHLLEVYNESLPRLESMDKNEIAKIIKENRSCP
jgi:hypothetical protein